VADWILSDCIVDNLGSGGGDRTRGLGINSPSLYR
jgi:hypothetical protein